MKALIERATGYRVFKILPRGVDPFFDIALMFPAYRFEEILDVGANVGQSASEFMKRFPGARITCFEPFDEAFSELSLRFANTANVKCLQLALGARSGKGVGVDSGRSDMNRVLPASEGDPASGGSEALCVSISTLDDYCRENSLSHISLLKIDTEGGDLEVLRGGSRSLTSQAADWIEVEAGVNPENQTHVPLEVLKSHLEEYSYRLFGIYEQIDEWTMNRPELRRVNLLFGSNAVLSRKHIT